MDDARVEQIIRQYLPQVVHMSLATAGIDGKPWICEVHFAFDEELNLYWQSFQDRRHSQEIAQQPRVAGNVVAQHFLNQKVRGVYFEGVAEKLEGVDKAHPGYQAYAGRLGKGLELLDEWAKPEGSRLYRLTVENFYLFDAYDSSPPQKYLLPWRQLTK
jgi:uncharacterized protein YhbP (UPF0306 family)